MNHLFLAVRHFNADSGLARNRRLYTDIRHGQVQLDIVRKANDPANLDTGIRLQLIAGNRRSLMHICHRHTDTETVKGFLQLLRRLPERSDVNGFRPVTVFEQFKRRKFIMINRLLITDGNFSRLLWICGILSTFSQCPLRSQCTSAGRCFACLLRRSGIFHIILIQLCLCNFLRHILY